MTHSLLIFDVDGVITNPLTGVVEPAVLGVIATTITGGESVALNTGRGIGLIMTRIVAPLRQQMTQPSALHHLCILHEKGALRTNFDRAGVPQPAVIATDIMIPPTELRTDILALLAEEFGQTMFAGDEKMAIISPEMIVGVDFAQFQAEQRRLVPQLQRLLRQHGVSEHFRIDPTRIATDVEDRRLGKALGARRVLEWLTETNMPIEQFITFGDSLSDIDMAAEIHRQGYSVQMIYVGDPTDIVDKHYPFPLILTQERYSRGTIEFLQSWQQ